MKIVFDLDNTISDDFGATLRPGIISLLESLVKDEHTLILWTHSKKWRATTVIKDYNLRKYFSKFMFREDYDPEGKGLGKDIRRVDGDLLIDDDPRQIDYVKGIGRKGFLVKSYHKGDKTDRSELEKLYSYIKKQSGVWGKISGVFRD